MLDLLSLAASKAPLTGLRVFKNRFKKSVERQSIPDALPDVI